MVGVADYCYGVPFILRRPPPPSRSTRVSPSDNGINEISTTTPPPTATSPLDQLLPPFLPEAPTAYITPGLDPFLTPPLLSPNIDLGSRTVSLPSMTHPSPPA